MGYKPLKHAGVHVHADAHAWMLPPQSVKRGGSPSRHRAGRYGAGRRGCWTRPVIILEASKGRSAQARLINGRHRWGAGVEVGAEM